MAQPPLWWAQLFPDHITLLCSPNGMEGRGLMVPLTGSRLLGDTGHLLHRSCLHLRVGASLPIGSDSMWCCRRSKTRDWKKGQSSERSVVMSLPKSMQGPVTFPAPLSRQKLWPIPRKITSRWKGCGFQPQLQFLLHLGSRLCHAGPMWCWLSWGWPLQMSGSLSGSGREGNQSMVAPASQLKNNHGAVKHALS